jgi:predicted nuclease of predicted toxin-antitoxin system
MEDEEAIKIATEKHRILITLDKDFGELVFKKGKKCRGIILLRIPPKILQVSRGNVNRPVKKEHPILKLLRCGKPRENTNRPPTKK